MSDPSEWGSPQAATDKAETTPIIAHVSTAHLARLVLAAFLATFIVARILVIFIMAGKLPPQLFFHARGTHVHHLNYGIFLLSATGGYLIFARPLGPRLERVAVVYGIGLALTFDEFGMWLNLGGSYWQRASYDAVVTVGAVLALIAYASKLKRFRPQHWFYTAVLALLVGAFGFVLLKSLLRYANVKWAPTLLRLEEQGPK